MYNGIYTIPETDDQLEIVYEFEAEQRGGRDDPSYPAAAYIVRVSANGIDITDLLSLDAIEKIENRMVECHDLM
jgi:hypothetical protein